METQPLSRRSQLLAMGGLALVLFLVSMDQTIVGTALPRIVADLNGFALYSWVTTAYLLVETAAIPIVGKLGDLYGRKWVVVVGVVIFLVGSVLCGLSTSMIQLVIFRGLQGLGGGAILATVFTLVADLFPDPLERARYQGIFAAVFALSSVVAPFIGGLLTDGLSWHWVFFVNLPIGLLALVVLPRVLPQTQRRPQAQLDWLGALTVTVAIVSLLLALTWVGDGVAWRSLQVLGGLLLSALAFVGFVLIERRAAEPIIPLGLFKNRALTVSAVIMFLFGFGMFGIVLYVPLFVQGVLATTATGSGAALTPLILTMTLMNIVSGQLVARVGRLRTLMLVGMLLFLAGVGLLTTIGPATTTSILGAMLFVVGLGMGIVMPVATIAVQTAVEPRELGVATSAIQFIRSIGSTVGTAVIGSVVNGLYATRLAATAPAGTPSALVSALSAPNALTNAAAQADLNSLADQNGVSGLVEPLLAAARGALAGSIQNGMLVVLASTVLALIAVTQLPKLELRATARQTAEVAV